MKFKRVTLLAGHYGSGKTNIAVNLAFELKKQHENTAIADVDIVNPYFRTLDSKKELEAAGIRVICSEYANTNLDAPALPQELYSITDNREQSVIVDVGGDDRGALALGRYAPAILEENNYDMLLVINCYRPLTRTAEEVLEVVQEIGAACSLPFTGIINNSNIGEETRAEHVLDSMAFANEVSRLTGLPLVMTTASQPVYEELQKLGKTENIFPLILQSKIK